MFYIIQTIIIHILCLKLLKHDYNSINEYISSFDTTKKFNMFIELMKKEEDKMKEVF